jgi:hypothetical protein
MITIYSGGGISGGFSLNRDLITGKDANYLQQN